jgi:hypothetical protein
MEPALDKERLSRRPTSLDDSDRWNEGRPIVARDISCRAAHLAIAIGRIGGNVDDIFRMGYCARRLRPAHRQGRRRKSPAKHEMKPRLAFAPCSDESLE